jgi:bacteriocin-like protein
MTKHFEELTDSMLETVAGGAGQRSHKERSKRFSDVFQTNIAVVANNDIYAEGPFTLVIEQSNVNENDSESSR